MRWAGNHRLAAAAEPPASPVSVDLGSAEARHVLLDGWSGDEGFEDAGRRTSFVWATGAESALRLPLPRGVYEEWRRWCLRPTHFGPDLQTYLADNVFGKIRAPVLNVGFSDDSIATRRTVDELDRFFPHVERESRWYTPADVGGRIGHEGFFHSRHRETLWRPTLDWLDSRLGLSA